MHGGNGFRHPLVVAGVRDQLDVKLEFSIKCLFIRPAVAINKIASVGHLESFAAQEPLVELHLTLVAVLPLGVEGHFRILAGGLVIHHDQFSVRTLPHIINRASKQEVRLFIEISNAGEIRPPRIKIVVRKRDRIDVVGLHKRVCDPFGPVKVEFLLEERIDSSVQVERKPRRLTNPMTAVDVETARAGHEVGDLRAAELVRLSAFWVEDIFGAFAGVVLGHR